MTRSRLQGSICAAASSAQKEMSSMSGIAAALSPRERSILEHIAQGQSNKEIARVLRIAPETVKSHVKNLFVKLGVERRAQAVYRAQGLGLVTTPEQMSPQAVR